MFNLDDLKNYSAMAKVIENSKMDIEGKAVIPTALLLKWYIELGQRIKKNIEEQQVVDEVVETAPVDEPIGDEV